MKKVACKDVRALSEREGAKIALAAARSWARPDTAVIGSIWSMRAI